ncbi:hypothetical protein WBU96_28405 [Bacillus albus]|uniref:hypothetical protein n=1 Tax=Bacillus albus TaxID=2026189 RepID=UPI0030153BE1
MLKTGDKAILQVTFDLVEQGGDYCFDDPKDFDRFVRGDMVEILRTVDNKTDHGKERDLAVIYNPKTYVSTTVAMRHLKPIKNTINIEVPVNVSVDPKKIADALTSLSESVKVVVGDPKKSEKGMLGTGDMKITSGTIAAKDLFKDTSMHVGGLLRGNNKISF